MEKWYVLHTKPNAEYQVARNLEAREFEVFLPTVRSHRPRRGRNDQPLFPSYLFTRLDIHATPLSQIQWTPGLRRVVSFGEGPVEVPEEVIELIGRRLGELGARGGLLPHSFQPGDRVRITEGPLQGIEAIFDGPMKPSERVTVLLEMLGRLSRAEVPLSFLERASQPSPNGEPRRMHRRSGRR